MHRRLKTVRYYNRSSSRKVSPITLKRDANFPLLKSSMESSKPSLELPDGKKILLLWCSSRARLPQEPKICKCRRSSMKGEVRMIPTDVTTAVAKRVSKRKGCDCDKECATRQFLEVFTHTMGLFGIAPTHWGFH
ncbi:hypothetical protein CEXT_558831 [Caerostris extrusa]|uniref:Uncharacterized protein n=1 Tax=Caerostris extrusa TaxID=172846 RepID=A0AAV4XTX5_CAEEX|nr:hypothetical protein CEXT_558831 [Caerostris extrusa]